MFISLDLETTGFYPEKDKIIEFGAVKFDLNGNSETLQFLVNPGITLPQVIKYITNIKDEDLKQAPKFEEKKEEIISFIGNCPIVGHNIKFDTDFLRANGLSITNPEYDTCSLASILIPSLPSYSLEILSKRLNLKHKEKHRALDDSIAAMELFIKLTDKFKNLPKETIERIHKLCEKTDHPLKKHLINITHEEGTNEISKKKSIKKESSHKEDLKDYLSKENQIIELNQQYEPLITELAKKIDKDSYISLPNNLFQSLLPKLPEEVAKVDLPEKYISTKRLKDLENKDFLKNYEFTSLIKYFIWINETKTGHLDEITLFNEEKITTHMVNIDESIEDPSLEEFFAKAIKKDQNSPSICSHRYLIEKTPKANQLLIFDFEKLTKEIFYAKSKILKLDFLINQLNELKDLSKNNEIIEPLISISTILFGLIGLLYENHNDRNLFSPKTEINENLFGTKELQNAKASVKNLIESSKNLIEISNEKTKGALKKWKKSLQTLQETIIEPNLKDYLTWIEKDYHENLVIHASPYSIKKYFKTIIEECENYKIISQNLNLNNEYTFAKSLIGIEEEIKTIKKTQTKNKMQIYISTHFQNEKEQIKNFIAPYLKITKGPTAIVLSSKKQLEFTTVELGKELKETNIKIISQLTGSLGKLKEQFKEDLENSVLLISPNFWDNFDNHKIIKNLIIQKIPFDPPSDPFIMTLSRSYKDPFNELHVPKAILNTNKIINLLTNDEEKEVVILDSRITEKAYGETMLNNLKNLATTKTVDLATLL